MTEFRDFCGPIWDVKRHGLSNPEWRRSSHLAASIQPAVRAKDVDFGFCFKRPIKKCFGSQVAGSTHPDTRAMALAVSASGIVAGARFPRDALCVRRRAPEAAKVRFPRAKSSDTSRRRRTDARFPTTSGASIAPLRRRGDGDARRASFDKQRPADLEPPEPPEPLGILSDILTPCLAFRARAGASHPPHLALSPPIRLGVNDLPENENDAAPRVRALVQRARHARAERTRVLAAERLGARPPPRPTAPRWRRSRRGRRRRGRRPSARSATCTTRARA